MEKTIELTVEEAKKIKITVTGDLGKVTIAGLVTWALMKFNVRPAFSGVDRNAWMNLVGDEMELSRQTAMLINNDQPLFEVAVDDMDVEALKAQLQAVTDERDLQRNEILALNGLLEKANVKVEVKKSE